MWSTIPRDVLFLLFYALPREGLPSLAQTCRRVREWVLSTRAREWVEAITGRRAAKVYGGRSSGTVEALVDAIEDWFAPRPSVDVQGRVALAEHVFQVYPSVYTRGGASGLLASSRRSGSELVSRCYLRSEDESQVRRRLGVEVGPLPYTVRYPWQLDGALLKLLKAEKRVVTTMTWKEYRLTLSDVEVVLAKHGETDLSILVGDAALALYGARLGIPAGDPLSNALNRRSMAEERRHVSVRPDGTEVYAK
jgi:hypothetical protein